MLHQPSFEIIGNADVERAGFAGKDVDEVRLHIKMRRAGFLSPFGMTVPPRGIEMIIPLHCRGCHFESVSGRTRNLALSATWVIPGRDSSPAARDRNDNPTDGSLINNADAGSLQSAADR